MQQDWHYAMPGQEQRTAQQQLPLGTEKQETALLSDLGNFSPGKSQVVVVPRLDHPCGAARGAHSPAPAALSRHKGGDCASLSQIAANPAREAMEPGVSVPSHVLPLI